jgi:hypothetical protein
MFGLDLRQAQGGRYIIFVDLMISRGDQVGIADISAPNSVNASV